MAPNERGGWEPHGRPRSGASKARLMSTRRTDAYVNDPDCQAFEDAQRRFLDVWIAERQGKSKAESDRLRVECDDNISAARELLDRALDVRGLRLDEHFGDHNVWVIDLIEATS